MDLIKAKQMANELITKHCPEYIFEFDNSVRRFGSCRMTLKLITLSKKLTELNDENRVKETILHEIAHAISPINEHHGRIWKMNAKILGIAGNRCYTEANTIIVKRKFVGIFPKCGCKIERFKRTKVSCGKCSNKFDPENIVIWKLK